MRRSTPGKAKSPGRSGGSPNVSPSKEFKRLTRSLELADAANRKTGRSRAKSEPPLTRIHHTTKLHGEDVFPQRFVLRRSVSATTPTTSNDSSPFSLKQEYIYNHEYFHFRIEQLAHKIKSDGTSVRVIVIFTANDRVGKGSSGRNDDTWCNECNYLESLISKFKSPIEHVGYLVRAKVGTMEEWMSLSNPYRLDKNIKLTSIPTIMVWNTEERLSGKAILDVNQLVAIFDESIEGDPWRRTNYKSNSTSRVPTTKFH